MFQHLGKYHEEAGYETVQDMVADFEKGEPPQLSAFMTVLNKRGLFDELKNHEWDKFALRYNGKGYEANNYHIKLAKAYEKHSK